MAQLSFTIADGHLTIGSPGRTYDYASTDYKAKAWRNGQREGVKIYSTFSDTQGHPQWSTENYTDWALVIDGVGYSAASVTDFVDAFNAACGSHLGFNTQYCQHIISDTIDMDTSVALQLTTHEKAGYLTITAETDNTGDVYVGDVDVDNTSYALEAGLSVFMELDDLSKIYAYAAVADCQVKIVGAYKY